VADRLEIPRVLVPRYPGVLCAFGLLVADIALDYARSVLGPVTEHTHGELWHLLADMVAQAAADLESEGIMPENRLYTSSLDVRYRGQAYELNIPFNEDTDIEAAFHSTHRQTYGHDLPGRVVEAVNLRLQAVGMVEHPVLTPEDGGNDEFAGARYAVPGDALLGEKQAAGGSTLTLYDREKLPPGARFAGPALVFQLDSTTYVAENWSARVDGYRNIIPERA
jgi:N-methylhydantoinase A/oxoprolinase/acetone carboxylase beta subunit